MERKKSFFSIVIHTVNMEKKHQISHVIAHSFKDTKNTWNILN